MFDEQKCILKQSLIVVKSMKSDNKKVKCYVRWTEGYFKGIFKGNVIQYCIFKWK